MSDDYNCFRCNGAFKWENLTQSRVGNLFCSPCWQQLNNEAVRRCPVDNSEMEKKRVLDLFLIDRCLSCGGTWFDKGELRLVQEKAQEQGWTEGFVLGAVLL